MLTRFHKMQGLGNDFVVLDARAASIAVTPATAQALADRRTGVGCDQIILIGGSDRADVSMRIWNADGSEVEACGNATRCVPVLVGRDCSVETVAGILVANLAGDGATVDMGLPRFGWNEIPLAYAMDTTILPVGWSELEHPTAVSMGNPHVVFFVDDIDAVPLAELGPTIEHDPLFPERINVNIATILDDGHLRMRTWERGSGLTLACGTGACATFAAGRKLGKLAPNVRLDLPGGILNLAERDDGHLLMSGPATHVFTGEIDLTRFG
jgi:diaminopimelate epimerase